MAKKFGASLSKAQFDFARKVERAGLASISQAVKAIERGNTEQIEEWKKQLREVK